VSIFGKAFVLPLILGSAVCLNPQGLFADSYVQTNIVSDIPGMAPITDANLKNPWGMSFSATSPFWTSNQGTNTSTLYTGTTTLNSLVVSVPGGPTGQVFAGGTAFTEPNGSAPNFVFATLGGSIYAWNGGNGTTAVQAGSTTGAVYTGLAINQAGNLLYASDVRNGRIDVYNPSFARTTVSGSFVDPTLPAGYTPYNIQQINGSLYVEYENRTSPAPGAGIVSVFDANGNFQRRLINPGGQLFSPWGIVMAPANFGQFSNDLLVGNFGNGEINAFNPTTGTFIGTLSDGQGNPIVNSGLWALATRTGTGFDTSAVYFTAGINNEMDGVFGKINAAPEPLSAALSGLGVLVLGAIAARRRAQDN
jgi:uncharacterized protein (TIGR03118 family)